jgi:signal transduction histidine kinase
VHVSWQAETLHLSVRDRGPGPNGHGDGHGLVGMRERVRIHGGRLHAGPAAGGGFEVAAELPLP